jgi:predicted transcriptional regulator
MSNDDLSPAEVDVLWGAPLGQYQDADEIRTRIKEMRNRDYDLATLQVLLATLAGKGYLLLQKPHEGLGESRYMLSKNGEYSLC